MILALYSDGSGPELESLLKDNTKDLEDIEKPNTGVFWSADRVTRANENYLRAKAYLKSLRAAEEKLEHAGASYLAIQRELNSFVEECRTLNKEHRELLLKVFEKDTIWLAPLPELTDPRLHSAIRDRLQARVIRYDHFLGELRAYNAIIREIRHYYDVNVERRGLGSVLEIDAFLHKSDLPEEIRLK